MNSLCYNQAFIAYFTWMLGKGEGAIDFFFFFPTDNKLLTEISTVTTIVKKKSNDLNVLL